MQTLVSSFVQLNFILLYLLDFRFLLVNQHFALAIEVIAKLRCLYSLQHEEAVIRFLIVINLSLIGSVTISRPLCNRSVFGRNCKGCIKKGKDETFQVWKSNVYSEAVNRINGRPPPKTGDFVLVADGTEKPIGWGLYNSVSMLCVRLMQLEEEATRNCLKQELMQQKVMEEAGSTLIRVIPYKCIFVNGEGDRILLAPGIYFSTEYKRSAPLEIPYHWLFKAGASSTFGSAGHVAAYSGFMQLGKVMVNGITYVISLVCKKTEFYADQRENRQLISTISNGLKVLDICSHSGGFALNVVQ
ncbi:hypothetical protein H0E87_016156 [Populus deltoides]|uniref:RlmI-like PUA domain-containing protein n=1 Tax=Populus deltoides TaxID=3696 RepID=A0A8T2Y861_POPDE|nr:hypothetical protein H0E87_016156 [Populus deltoides]